MRIALRRSALDWMLLALLMTCVPAGYAGNQVMGELEFQGKSKVEKTSGVWVDGEYVGYLKELKGSKKVLLLPGEHVISVRQDGFQDFTQRVVLQPGEKKTVFVAMHRAATGVMPAVTATVKISVNPSRAAVFLDGLFVGHVGEFQGAGRGMLVAPGKHTLRIALPGYQTFETQISALPRQTVEVKTELLRDENRPVADPMLNPSPSGAGTFAEPAISGAPASPSAAATPVTQLAPSRQAAQPSSNSALTPSAPAPQPAVATVPQGIPGAPASDNGPPPLPEPAHPSSPQRQ